MDEDGANALCTLSVVLAFFAPFLLVVLWRACRSPPGLPPPTIRTEWAGGARLETVEEAQEVIDAQPKSRLGPPGFWVPWGPLRLGLEQCFSHLMTMALPKAGKTAGFIFPLVAAWARWVGAGFGFRMIILDSKKEFVPLVNRCAHPHAGIYVMDSTDIDGCYRDINEYAETEGKAQQWSANIIPREMEGSDRFWTDKGRNLLGQTLLAAVYLRAQKGARDVTLGDVVRLSSPPRRTAELLSKCPFTKDGATYLKGRLGQNLSATVAARLEQLREMAAGMEAAQKRDPTNRFSVREFLRHGAPESIAILPYDAERGTAHDIQNSLDVAEVIRRQLSLNDPRLLTLVVLDEVHLLSQIDLDLLFRTGRSTGLILAVGLQTRQTWINALRHQGRADEYLEFLQGKCFGRLGEATAVWASEIMGVQTLREYTRSVSYREPRPTWSDRVLFAVQERFSHDERVGTTSSPLVTPRELTELPLADPVGRTSTFYIRNPVTGRYVFAEVPFGPFMDEIDFDKAKKLYAGHKPRPASELVLRAYGAQDEKKWGIK